MMKAKLEALNIQQGRESTLEIILPYKIKDFMPLITINEAVVLQFHPQINNKVSSIGTFHPHINQHKLVRKITLSKNKLSIVEGSINRQIIIKSQGQNIKETVHQLLVVLLSIRINNMKLKMKDFPSVQIIELDNPQARDSTFHLKYLRKSINLAQNKTK